jgi:hypothetical protein
LLALSYSPCSSNECPYRTPHVTGTLHVTGTDWHILCTSGAVIVTLVQSAHSVAALTTPIHADQPMRSHHSAHFNLCPFRPRACHASSACSERVPHGRDLNEVTAKCNHNSFAQCRASWFTENAISGLDTRARKSRLRTTSRNGILFISLTSSAVGSSEHRSNRVFGIIGVGVGRAGFIANRCSVSSM